MSLLEASCPLLRDGHSTAHPDGRSHTELNGKAFDDEPYDRRKPALKASLSVSQRPDACLPTSDVFCFFPAQPFIADENVFSGISKPQCSGGHKAVPLQVTLT